MAETDRPEESSLSPEQAEVQILSKLAESIISDIKIHEFDLPEPEPLLQKPDKEGELPPKKDSISISDVEMTDRISGAKNRVTSIGTTRYEKNDNGDLVAMRTIELGEGRPMAQGLTTGKLSLVDSTASEHGYTTVSSATAVAEQLGLKNVTTGLHAVTRTPKEIGVRGGLDTQEVWYLFTEASIVKVEADSRVPKGNSPIRGIFSGNFFQKPMNPRDYEFVGGTLQNLKQEVDRYRKS